MAGGGGSVTNEEFASLGAELAASGSRVRKCVLNMPAECLEDVVHAGDGPWTGRPLLAHIAANDLRPTARIRTGAGIGNGGRRDRERALTGCHR